MVNKPFFSEIAGKPEPPLPLNKRAQAATPAFIGHDTPVPRNPQ
jgi:hypothetical protein